MKEQFLIVLENWETVHVLRQILMLWLILLLVFSKTYSVTIVTSVP